MSDGERRRDRTRALASGPRIAAAIVGALFALGTLAASANDDRTDARIAEFLKQRYGAQAHPQAHWQTTPTTPDGTITLDHRVCARAPAPKMAPTAHLLAVCTKNDFAGHVESGRIDFHLISVTTTGVATIAELRDQAFGAFGDPGRVQVVRLGHRLYGFHVETRDAGSGHAFKYRHLLMPRDGSFSIAMTSLMSHLFDGSGRCSMSDAETCREGASIDLASRMRIDTDRNDDAHYPLIVDEYGVACGRRVYRRHVLPFDPKTGVYPVPEALLRDTCPPAP